MDRRHSLIFLPESLRRQRGYINPSVLSAIGGRRRSGNTGGGGGGGEEPPATDPHFANVVALLHMDGDDGATVIQDHAPVGSPSRVWTASNQAQIDTAQSQFGGASLLLDGTGDFVSTPDHAALELAGNDFTLELWGRTTTVTGNHVLCAKQTNAGSFSGFDLLIVGNSAQFFATSAGASWDIASGRVLGTVATNTWYHFAVCRSGNTWAAFLDGVQGSTWTSAAAIQNNGNALCVGALPDASTGWNGWIDDFRLTIGVNRYIGSPTNFTRPSAAFPNS